jgi:alanine racemase
MMAYPPKSRAWAQINLGALERNLKAIRAALPPHLRFISVVKADAYGHGLAPVVTRLMQAEAHGFAVANLQEAARLAEVGTGWPILVLSALLPDEYPAALELGVTPVISSIEEARGLLAAREPDKPLSVHLKIDTGMGRLGVWHSEFAPLWEQLSALQALSIEGLCTHFSSADSDEAFTRLQRQRFLDCLKVIPQGKRSSLILHADNSAGIDSFPVGGPFNAIRLGLLQFGVAPRGGGFLHQIPVEPVLSLHCRIGLVKTLPEGTPISYNQSYRLPKTSPVGILTAGYADGIPTAFSNRGQVLIRGCRCPVIGRVTMDQIVVDLSELPEIPQTGELATLIGSDGSEHLTVLDFAKASNQVAWEALASISSRTRRIYHT